MLEYGSHKKAVVVTDVGEIPLLIQNGRNGFLVASQEPLLFYQALVQLIESDDLRIKFGTALYRTMELNYSEATVIKKYLNWL